MWDQSNDINQAGGTPAGDPMNISPMQSGNYLSPQQRYQMGQYANSLMGNQGNPPITSALGGLAQLGKSAVGGYFMNKAYPNQQQSNSSWSPQALFSGLFGGSSPSS